MVRMRNISATCIELWWKRFLIRSGRMVSRPVRMVLCIRAARMAASIREVVRRVSIGWRCGGDACSRFEGRSGSVEVVVAGLGGRLVWR